MLDITKSIELNPQEKKIYTILRTILYVAAFAVGLAFVYIVLFPSTQLTLSFPSANPPEGKIPGPRDQNGVALKNGELAPDQQAILDAVVGGNYSSLNIEATLGKNSALPQNLEANVIRSFYSFLYPEGAPMELRDGSLLKVNDTFFIVSDGKLRQFQSPETAKTMGFPEESFASVTEAELQNMAKGEPIIPPNKKTLAPYPNGTLFLIDQSYYQLKGGILSRFVSEAAYFSRYDKNQAIQKEAAFLKNFTVAKELIGFADGKLVSHADAVYILSGEKSLPIDNVKNFEILGFNWDDVTKASSEEMGLYKRAGLFSLDSPHPDGTIFLDNASQRYFYIQDGQRREIQGAYAIKSYVRQKPVPIENKQFQCQLKKAVIFSHYSCQLPVGEVQEIPGNDYRISLSTPEKIKLKDVQLTFSRGLNKKNLILALSKIKYEMEKNYGLAK